MKRIDAVLVAGDIANLNNLARFEQKQLVDSLIRRESENTMWKMMTDRLQSELREHERTVELIMEELRPISNRIVYIPGILFSTIELSDVKGNHDPDSLFPNGFTAEAFANPTKNQASGFVDRMSNKYAAVNIHQKVYGLSSSSPLLVAGLGGSVSQTNLNDPSNTIYRGEQIISCPSTSFTYF